MPALCLILNSAYYAKNYAGIFDSGLMNTIIEVIPYKMKILRRIYFGGLANYENPPD